METGYEKGLSYIAVSVNIDGEHIYRIDSLAPAFFGLNYGLVEMPLKMGFHSIDVSTPTTGVETKRTVFILFSHYIMIDYWDGREKFTVRTGFNPFKLE